jgi:hypothetical protein
LSSLPDPISAGAPSASEFIGASIELLEKECPQAYTLLCSQMAGRQAWFSIGGDPVRLAFIPDRILLQPPEGDGDLSVRLITDWATVLDLADAKLTLVDAVLSSRLDLLAEAKELALFYAATLTYLRGAVRCPSFPALLDRLRLAHPQ